MIPKILLGAPISMNKAYILNEWLDYVKSLTYPNLHVLLVDNSKDPEWCNRIAVKGFHVIHVEPKGRPESYIADCQEVIRKYAIVKGFDFLFSLECDNFAPTNIIELLLAYRVDNINVPYFLKGGNETTLGVQVAGVDMAGYRNYNLLPVNQSIHYMTGQLQTGIPSIGCSLFSRNLIMGQKFRVEVEQPGTFSDSFWHFDSKRRGITPYVDTSLFSEHKRDPQWWKQK